MALVFYYGSGSPFAWRVWLGLEHKRIPYVQKTVSFSAGDLRKPEYTAINPRQKVPAIVDDAFALYESDAILEYLDEKYPAPRLFPGDAQQRALTRRMIREADLYFGGAMDAVIDEVLFKPQAEWDTDAIAKGRAAMAQELALWETLMRGDFLAGELSAADFTLYPLLALSLRSEKKKPDIDLRSIIGPKVTAWMKRIESLQYFQKTWPPHWK
jgi:glutathione S-transferase